MKHCSIPYDSLYFIIDQRIARLKRKLKVLTSLLRKPKKGRRYCLEKDTELRTRISELYRLKQWLKRDNAQPQGVPRDPGD